MAVYTPENLNTDVLELELSKRFASLKAWLLNDAFDMWWHKGADQTVGGFFERIAQDGKPMREDKRRARVQPRQAYCYAVAKEFGWSGPWREAIEHGLTCFEKTYALDGGIYGNLADANTNLIDGSFDLYNQAFAIFGFAAAARAIPGRSEHYHQMALKTLDALRQNYAHPVAGFQEASPPREPLCANPHMHMFEAALAWAYLRPDEPRWDNLVEEIGMLAMKHLIDPTTGALPELYDLHWKPLQGDTFRIEPGHQFEWAWLLCIWGERQQKPEPIALAKGLFTIGQNYGICSERNVAVMGLNKDLSVRDPMARLWAQTEWLKAASRLAKHSSGRERAHYLQSALKAEAALSHFLQSPVKGLWYDRWEESNRRGIIEEPAPASTFYHIVAAVSSEIK